MRLAVGVVVFLLVFFTGTIATHADTTAIDVGKPRTSANWVRQVDLNRHRFGRLGLEEGRRNSYAAAATSTPWAATIDA